MGLFDDWRPRSYTYTPRRFTDWRVNATRVCTYMHDHPPTHEAWVRPVSPIRTHDRRGRQGSGERRKGGGTRVLINWLLIARLAHINDRRICFLYIYLACIYTGSLLSLSHPPRRTPSTFLALFECAMRTLARVLIVYLVKFSAVSYKPNVDNNRKRAVIFLHAGYLRTKI